MNKIICDNQECKKEIKLTKESIETKFLKDGIQINFFRCGKCNDKYLIDVTDAETREKQMNLAKKQKYQTELAKTITKYNLETLEKEMIDNTEAMENLLKEIKVAKAELKAKYEGEL